MRINPYRSPEAVDQSPERKFLQWKSMLIGFLVVAGTILMLGALLLPATRSAREPARRSQCGNNLKQISLALRGYELVHHALPPAYTVDSEGRPLHSWRTLILPFMEHQALYERIELSKPWNDPANKAAFETQVEAYRCPSANCPETHTTYLAVVAPGSCFQPTESRRLSEIADDHNLTLMVVEANAAQAVHWMSPADATEEWIKHLQTGDVLSHPGGAQAVTVSGRVHFVSAASKPAQLRALISIDGNDDAIADGND